jgi:hypothetical protein
MSMMDVRDMWMPVLTFFVIVLVAMAEDASEERERRRLVVVVPFPMPMPVRVDGLRVDMVVRMAIPEKENPGESHEPESDGAREGRDLAEQERRESEAEERGRGEEELGARSAEPLGRGDVEHDTRPVRERTDDERATERGQTYIRMPFDEETDREIDRSRRDALDESAGLGRETVDEGGEVVVEPPGHASAGHEEAGRQGRGPSFDR